MRSSGIRCRIGVLLVLAACPALRASDAPTPRGLGLLAGRVSDAEVADRLRVGLRDPSPQTRAAAVRVINVSRVDGLIPDVQDALSRETDAAAASEMIRLLGALAHPEADTSVLAAAERLGFATHGALADGLGRRGPAAYVHLPRLRALGLNGGTLGMFFRLATQGASGPLGPAAAPILRDGAAEAWAMLLEDARAATVSVDDGLLVASMRAPSPALRAATYWHVAVLAVERPPGPALAEAFRGTPDATPTADPTAAVPYELARRALAGERVRNARALPALPADLALTVPRDVLLDDRVVDLLTKDERKKLELAVYGYEGFLGRVEKPSKNAGRSTGPREVPILAFTHTLSDLPVGYAADIMAAARCAPAGNGGTRGGVVTYGADGRPQAVMLLDRDDTPACEQATRALVASSLAPLGVPIRPGGRVLVLVPDRKGFLECVEEAARVPLVAPGRDASEPLGELTRTAGEYPNVPQSAFRANVRGTVFLKAALAPSGCVHRVTLVRGVDPRLDVAAIEAVASWRYRLPKFSGPPLPVEIQATTTFR